MQIEVLHVAGCPHLHATVALVRQVAVAYGIVPDLQCMEIGSEEEACRARFLGSPTVRVDGQDIEPEARTRTDFGLSCRLYGRTGTPPRQLIEAALIGSGLP